MKQNERDNVFANLCDKADDFFKALGAAVGANVFDNDADGRLAIPFDGFVREFIQRKVERVQENQRNDGYDSERAEKWLRENRLTKYDYGYGDDEQ